MAAKFQAVTVKDLSGNAKASGRPYEMRIVGGLFTSEDGVVEMGEISFMKGDNRPLPMVVPGQAYTPVIGATTRDGKLLFQITELKPMTVPAAGRTAAAA